MFCGIHKLENYKPIFQNIFGNSNDDLTAAIVSRGIQTRFKIYIECVGAILFGTIIIITYDSLSS